MKKITVSELKVGDKLIDYNSQQGSYLNVSVSQIGRTKTGRYNVWIYREWNPADGGEKKIEFNRSLTHGAVKGNHPITIKLAATV